MVTANKATSLKDYLKRYQDGKEEEEKKLKKKKKKSKPDNAGVIVVDEDPFWQKPVKFEEEEDDDLVDEKPQVDEDIEVKRMKRLEEARSKRPLGMVSEDGSGWVSISDTPKMVSSSDQISDISPPRRRRADTPSPERELKAADLSPPHKQRARNDSLSIEREIKVADLSPPRKRRARNDSPSTEREIKVADLSPPRKQRARNDNPSPEAELKASAIAYTDLSPPRKHRLRDDSSSLQHEKKSSKTTVADLSPPRRQHKHYRSSMPGRETTLPSTSSIDLNGQNTSDTTVAELASSVLDLSPPRKMWKKLPTPKQQAKTGLVTGQDIKEEIAKTKKEELLRFKEMDPYVSGRGAEPVYRDKITGERMSKDQFLKSQKKEEEKPKEVKLEWGKGLAQKREAEARLQELAQEKQKPFARSRDDPELDKMLKDRVRWGDPMAHLVKKKQLESVLPDLGDDEKMKESGFIIPQEIPSHSWIRRGLDFPPNRYGIKPGRHWDCVDRSTGFEKQLFKRMNEKQATQREAYLWSVSDM